MKINRWKTIDEFTEEKLDQRNLGQKETAITKKND